MRIVDNVLAFYGPGDFLSNHHICTQPFTIRGYVFNCMEQYIMFAKAMFFGDVTTANKILKEARPQQQKWLGREVSPYIEDEWIVARAGIYIAGLRHRYDQNPHDKQRLIDTHPFILAEASDRDINWGVGYNERDPRIAQPHLWKGNNLCGRQQQVLRNFYRRTSPPTSEKARISR